MLLNASPVKSPDFPKRKFDVGASSGFCSLHRNISKIANFLPGGTSTDSKYAERLGCVFQSSVDLSRASWRASNLRAAAEGFVCTCRRQCTLPTTSCDIDAEQYCQRLRVVVYWHAHAVAAERRKAHNALGREAILDSVVEVAVSSSSRPCLPFLHHARTS